MCSALCRSSCCTWSMALGSLAVSVAQRGVRLSPCTYTMSILLMLCRSGAREARKVLPPASRAQAPLVAAKPPQNTATRTTLRSGIGSSPFLRRSPRYPVQDAWLGIKPLNYILQRGALRQWLCTLLSVLRTDSSTFDSLFLTVFPSRRSSRLASSSSDGVWLTPVNGEHCQFIEDRIREISHPVDRSRAKPVASLDAPRRTDKSSVESKIGRSSEFGGSVN